MKLSYRKFDLPLRHVFTISRGSVSVQQTLIVQLESEGQYGYGESTTNTFYGATIENMSSTIESVRSIIEESTLEDPLAVIAAVTNNVPHAKYAKFALNAIDLAVHDLWGKLRGAPV